MEMNAEISSFRRQAIYYNRIYGHDKNGLEILNGAVKGLHKKRIRITPKCNKFGLKHIGGRCVRRLNKNLLQGDVGNEDTTACLVKWYNSWPPSLRS